MDINGQRLAKNEKITANIKLKTEKIESNARICELGSIEITPIDKI